MKKDVNEIFQKMFEKITKALGDSNFSACTALSNEMLRIADYSDFADGVFVGEFLESLFMNIDSTYRKYDIDKKIFDNLKEDIVNLLSYVKDSFPQSNEAKVDLYNSMTKVRASVTKLQLESFRGELTRKSKGISRYTGEHIGEILGNIEDIE
jgi:hypothetical protein